MDMWDSRIRWSATPLRVAIVLSFASVVLAAAPGPVATQTLQGVLLERGSDRPIEFGLMTLLTLEGDSVDAVLTDEEGRFIFRSDTSGEFLLNAVALGYEGSTTGVYALGEGGSMAIEYRLEPVGIEIEGLSVEARRSLMSQPKLVQNGFVDRAQRGFGRFITPYEVERATDATTAELLRRTGRVDVQYSVFGPIIRMLGTRGYCTPIVYVDGSRIALGADPSIESVVPIAALEAAEVYRSPNEAPIQFGGGFGGSCGVVVLWTKSR